MTVDVTGYADDAALFHSLGFDSVESIDYSDFEGATHVADLNQEIPDHLKNRFDVVLDGGTLEHVFNLPQALKNACAMVKIGGRLILSSPSSNHMDHGFYMFSPTLFMDFFRANEWTVNTFYIVRYGVDSARPWKVYEYRPGDHGRFFIGALDRAAYGIFAVATKTEKSTGDRIPQQSHYITAWNAEKPAQSRLKAALRFVPGAVAAGIHFKSFLLKRGIRGLRYIGRY